jgi:hypothetical protein
MTTIFPYVQGKYYNYSKGYLDLLPIKLPSNKKEQEIADGIVENVKEILKAKKKDNEANTGKLEKEVDDLVFKLYGLTTEERKIIEESLKEN